MSLQKALQHLKDQEESLSRSLLYYFSCLEREEHEALFELWASVSVERRRSLLRNLAEIAEADFEVNFDPIFRFALQDEDARVRVTAIEGLWEDEDPSLIDPLLSLLHGDSSVAVRAAAATSLGRFVLLSELGKLAKERGQPIYEALYALITEAQVELEIRRRAMESIAYVNIDPVAQLLSRAYAHPEEKMRVSAIFGMGRSADPRWVDTVLGELYSSNPEMRYEAARACGEIQARQAVPDLAHLIDDPDREVQGAALWALGQIGGKKARKLLERACQEGDAVTRTAAQAALEQLLFFAGSPDWLSGDFVYEDDDEDL